MESDWAAVIKRLPWLAPGAKARLWLVDTVAAKDQIFSRLRIEAPGFGYIHFPQDLEPALFDQFLAERPVRRGGRRAYKKITADARNEGLDLLVYCAAAMEIFNPSDLGVYAARAAKLAEQEAALEVPGAPESAPLGPAQDTLEDAVEAPPAPAPLWPPKAPVAKHVLRPAPRRGRDGFGGGW